MPGGIAPRMHDPAVEFCAGLSYADDHWAVAGNRLAVPAAGDQLRVAELHWGHESGSESSAAAGTAPPTGTPARTPHVPMVVRLHPMDARGHRSLVTVTDEKEPRLAFNRPAEPHEYAALGAGLALMRHVYQRMGAVGQTSVAGNNAHSLRSPPRKGGDVKVGDDGGHEVDGVDRGGASGAVSAAPAPTGSRSTSGSHGDSRLVAGSPHEPSLLHGHVIGRGPPARDCMVRGVPLRGPPPGVEFPLREGKEAYAAGEAARVVAALRAELKLPEVVDMARALFHLDIRLPLGHAALDAGAAGPGAEPAAGAGAEAGAAVPDAAV